MTLTLYSYWRSTAAYRVRIALNLKGLDYETKAVHLVKNGGEQHQAGYREVNPQGLVPSLVTEDGHVITQSMAILEYLEEYQPAPSILPEDAISRAHCRAAAQTVVSDIHPLDNLRVLQYLKKQGWQQDRVDTWYAHWIHEGFKALEQQASSGKTQFMHADYPCISDICLVAQIYNANRFQVPLNAYPRLTEIYQHCMVLDEFIKASPEQQPDAPEVLA
ncbi:maleylacetoacetate isomerase [Marinicella gelatinilytica]|uniref:maleylacetoacetate isomerase n=1 Tax=Marinicella gelatinilytica TaxID=2996017 RepID=UPI002260C5CC|nr:maleylacetoacetate isomerase [Marinicella gelatinilytica]MCX7543808.1 maleylacetoacetate isomerase [Marinicella gelatinilytica]